MWSNGKRAVSALTVLAFALLSRPSSAHVILGPEELVQVDGVELSVPGYSVPSFVLWDGDALPDLVVGEGGGTSPDGKVRIYPNVGGSTKPAFESYFYVQSAGSDLIVPGGG